jgi:hypothetical protein
MKTIVYYPPAKGVNSINTARSAWKRKIKIGKDQVEIETYKDIPTYNIPDSVETSLLSHL